ncbi:unnamed protein product, partial [Nesidiocoris tenuis]
MMPGPALFPDYIFTRMGPDDVGRDERSPCRRWLAQNLFLVCTLLGVAAGIIFGTFTWNRFLNKGLFVSKMQIYRKY